MITHIYSISISEEIKHHVLPIASRELFFLPLSWGDDQKWRLSQGGRLIRIHRQALRQNGRDRSGVWHHHRLWHSEQNASHGHSERPRFNEADQGRGTALLLFVLFIHPTSTVCITCLNWAFLSSPLLWTFTMHEITFAYVKGHSLICIIHSPAIY